jgi:hypothetical protein
VRACVRVRVRACACGPLVHHVLWVLLLVVVVCGEWAVGQVLKVDCERCEYEVLPDLHARGALARVGRIVGEVHPWAQEAGSAFTRARYDWLLEQFCTAYYWRGVRHKHEAQVANSEMECLKF